MALTQKQFDALKTQLEKKKQSLGDDGYSQFLNEVSQSNKAEESETRPVLQQVGTGAAKELGSTGLGVGSLGRGIQKGLSKAVGAITGAKDFGMGGESVFDKGQKRQKAESLFTPTTGAEKVGAFATKAATFAIPSTSALKATKGANFLTRTGALVASDVGSTVVQQGEFNKESIDAAIIAAAFPVVGKAAQIAKGALPSGADTGGRVINSLIKPLLKDFSYGKNPGKAVAEAGITGNSLDELASNIKTARQETGKQVSDIVANNTGKFDATDSLSAIDEAIVNAQKAPQTNAAIINRLQGIKSDLLQVNADGIPQRNLKNLTANELWEFNKEIGDLARWTGNASDDEIINKAVRTAYGNTRTKLEKEIPELADISEKYANLKSAEVAAEYRDKIAARQGMVSFSGAQVGTAGALVTAIATGGAAIPTILMGATAATANEAFKSPAVKTRLAAWLATAPKAEKDQLFKQQPWLRSSIQAALFDEENLDESE